MHPVKISSALPANHPYRELVFGERQSEYLPLPALLDNEGTVITEWEPSIEELAVLLSGEGRIRVTLLLTGIGLKPGAKLTPLKVQVVEKQAPLLGA